MAGVADKNALKAGLFIMAAVVLALIVFASVGGWNVSKTNEWVVQFDLQDDVGGIGSGSEVRIGGVKRGQVEKVDLTDDYSTIRIHVSLPDDLQLREGVLVQVQSTVTGVAWLNIRNLGDGASLDQNDPLPGQAGTISDLVATVNNLAPAVQELVDDVRENTLPRANSVLTETEATITAVRASAETVREQLEPSLTRYNTVADAAVAAAESVKGAADETGRAAGNIASAIGDEGPNSDLGTTLANLSAASDRLPQVMDDVSRLTTTATTAINDIRGSVSDTTEQLSAVLELTRGVAKDGKDVSASLKGLIAGNRGKINQIVDRLQKTSSTLELAAQEIRRSPWRLLYQPDGERRESLDLYDTARRFAEGANALEDASVALRDAAADPNTPTEDLEKLLSDVEKQFDEFEAMQSALYKQLR